MSSKGRNRVNYQSEFLYTSFNATGYHFADNVSHDPNCKLRNLNKNECSGNLVEQLHRIQSVNYNINTNYININQYGKAARIDGVISTSPDVTLDFEYFLADGYNEQAIGFITDGITPALRKHMLVEDRFGSNFFIVTGPDGRDIIGANLDKYINTEGIFNDSSEIDLPFQLMHDKITNDITTLGIGNAFLSQYAVTAEVGSLPKARLSFDAFNVRVYNHFCNLPLPTITSSTSCAKDLRFSIPDTYESFVYQKVQGLEDITLQEGVPGLRSTEISITLGDIGAISKQLDKPKGFTNDYSKGAANIQGFTINVPIGTTKINRIGDSYAFTRTLNFPSKIDIQIKALVSELKKLTNIDDLCLKKPTDVILDLHDYRCLVVCTDEKLNQTTSNMKYIIKGAVLESEGFSLNIGDNKIVELTLSASVSGPEDKDAGLFIFGKSFLADKPSILSWGNLL